MSILSVLYWSYVELIDWKNNEGNLFKILDLVTNLPFHPTHGLEKIIYEDGLIQEHDEINFLDHNGQVVEYNTDKFNEINLPRSNKSDRENILFHLYTR